MQNVYIHKRLLDFIEQIMRKEGVMKLTLKVYIKGMIDRGKTNNVPNVLV